MLLRTYTYACTPRMADVCVHPFVQGIQSFKDTTNFLAYLSMSLWCTDWGGGSCSPQDLQCAHPLRLPLTCQFAGCSVAAESVASFAQMGQAY